MNQTYGYEIEKQFHQQLINFTGILGGDKQHVFFLANEKLPQEKLG
jgi:hypothetical protein